MFVIVQCWDVLESKYRARKRATDRDEELIPLPERFGQTMSSAGGAITVTSFTDIVGESGLILYMQNQRSRLY